MVFTCRECGRKFGSRSALGGHMKNAHARDPSESTPASPMGSLSSLQAAIGTLEEEAQQKVQSEQDQSQEQGPHVEAQPAPPAGDEGVMESIRDLLRKGYSPRQIKEQFDYARRTVDAVVAEGIEPEGKGDGKLQRREDSALAPTMKEKETIVPEWLAGQVKTLYDGDERTAQVFMAGMSIPLLGIRLFAESMRPFGDLLKLWNAGQVEAARAVQGSGQEMARQAAHDAAMQVAGYFEERKPWLEGGTDPVRAMFADAMRPLIENVTRAFMPQQEGQEGAPPGFTRRKEAQDDV